MKTWNEFEEKYADAIRAVCTKGTATTEDDVDLVFGRNILVTALTSDDTSQYDYTKYLPADLDREECLKDIIRVMRG